MMKIGATTIPLAGWLVNPQKPERERMKHLEAIQQIVTHYRLEAVELTLDFSMLYPEVFNQEFYSATADLQQELDFICTLHLPFLWIDPCAMNEIIRRASVDAICTAYEMCAPLEVETCVLHLWGNMTQLILSVLDNPMRLIRVFHQQAERSLNDLHERIPIEKICVETLEKPSFELFADVVEAHEMGICLDVGHLYWQKEGYIDFLTRYNNQIKEVHLHDAKRKTSEPGGAVHDHLPLGEGEIDPAAFLKHLEETGYKGTVIVENNTREDFDRSMRWMDQWMGK